MSTMPTDDPLRILHDLRFQPGHRPDPEAVAVAAQALPAMEAAVQAAGLEWSVPDVTADGVGNVWLEWDRGAREISLHAGIAGLEGVCSQGGRVAYDFDGFRLARPEDIVSRWRWLAGLGRPEDGGVVEPVSMVVLAWQSLTLGDRFGRRIRAAGGKAARFKVGQPRGVRLPVTAEAKALAAEIVANYPYPLGGRIVFDRFRPEVRSLRGKPGSHALLRQCVLDLSGEHPVDVALQEWRADRDAAFRAHEVELDTLGHQGHRFLPVAPEDDAPAAKAGESFFRCATCGLLAGVTGSLEDAAEVEVGWTRFPNTDAGWLYAGCNE
jgi:hypothetical protein